MINAIKRKRGLRWLPLFFWLFGCTDASLELLPPEDPPLPDNKMQVHGELCTQNPEDLDFPVRVVFLVDRSVSMAATDPVDPVTGETGRERAVRESVEYLLNSGGDVKVSVVAFSAESQPITPDLTEGSDSYFTDDLDYVLEKIPALSITDRTTNYIQALAEAYTEIRTELTNADQESLALSSYQVIMITDGIPDVDSGNASQNASDNLRDSVEAIMELGRLFHLNRIGVNTALLSSGNVLVDETAEDLLGMMAETGNGTFRSFASGGDLNFLNVDLTAIKRMFTLRTLVAQNLNSRTIKTEILPDADGDGIDDMQEIITGSNPYSPDSDGDGCRDSVEYHFRTSGLDPTDPNDCNCLVPDYCFDEDADLTCDNGCTDADEDGLCDCIDANRDGLCDPSNYTDVDGDGLFDCEELYTGTNRNGADADGDGLVDFLEFRAGTSPDLADADGDLDWDAITNGEEVRTATDPLNEIQAGRSNQAYRYNVQEVDSVAGITCYEFDVSNISITDVEGSNPLAITEDPGGQGYTGRNRVLIYAGEVPFDDPESYARFRVACVEATYRSDGNYKNPPSGRIVISEDQFVALDAFNPAVDCVPPGGDQ